MKHKILCIDDEAHNLEALERLLRKSHDVILAESGSHGLEKLKEHNFSLIISDQKMPEMTGVEFLMEAVKHQPDALRILLTGYTDLESVIGAINQGQIYRYITKPWDPQEFLGVVQQAIDVFEMKKTISLQNEKLTLANEELKSLDRLKTDFMLLVSHELKTPLTAIFSYTQLLSEEKLEPDHKLYIDKISLNTTRLQNLINDTLLITRLKSDTKKLETQTLNISELLQESWTKQAVNFSKKSLSFDLKNTDAFLQKTNEVFIRIIIDKLIHNSLSHAKAKTTASFQLSDDNKSWFIETQNQLQKKIEKTPKELLSSFSTNQNILNHSGGTGLGLAVIQAILQLFSAHIEINYDDKLFNLKISIPKK